MAQTKAPLASNKSPGSSCELAKALLAKLQGSRVYSLRLATCDMGSSFCHPAKHSCDISHLSIPVRLLVARGCGCITPPPRPA